MSCRYIRLIRQIKLISCFFTLFLAAACTNAEKNPPIQILLISVSAVLMLEIFEILRLKNSFDCAQGMISEKRLPYEWGIMIVCICTRLPLLTQMQRWDGGQYYYALGNACRDFDFTWESFWSGFRLVGHPALGASFFWSIGEFLVPRGVLGVTAVNMVMTIAALLCIYRLLSNYWTDMTCRQAFFSTCILTVAPLYCGTFSYVNVDYAMFLFFIFMVYTEYRKEYILMAFWLVMMLMTKEPAVVAAFGYFAAKLLGELLEGRRKEQLSLYRFRMCGWLWVGIFGALIYICYIIYQGSLFIWGGNTSVSSLILNAPGRQSDGFGFDKGYIIHILKQIFILNFTWIFSALLIVSLILCLRKRNEGEKAGGSPVLGPTGALAAFAAFNCSYRTAALCRYQVLPVMLVIIIAVLISYQYLYPLINPAYARSAAVMAGGLLLIQSFYSIDPLSNALFPRLNTGNGFILQTDYDSDYYGDGLVYNAQYMGLDRVLNRMLKEAGYDSSIQIFNAGTEIAGVQLNGNTFRYRLRWDSSGKIREVYDDASINDSGNTIRLISTQELFGKLPYQYDDFIDRTGGLADKGLVYFIPYYGEDETEILDCLKKYYFIGERRTVQSGQWEIAYYPLDKADSFEGYSLSDFPEYQETDSRIMMHSTEEITDYLESCEPDNALVQRETARRLYGNYQALPLTEERICLKENDVVNIICHAYFENKELPLQYFGNYTDNIFTTPIGSGELIEELEALLPDACLNEPLSADYQVPDTYPAAGRYRGKTIHIEMLPLSISGTVEFSREAADEAYLNAYHFCKEYRRNQELKLLSVSNLHLLKDADSAEYHKILNEIDVYYHRKAALHDREFEKMLEEYWSIDSREYYSRIDKMARAVLLKRQIGGNQ